MKRIYALVICIFMVLLLFLAITQCSKNTEVKEKKLITDFTETYFTTPGEDTKIFKKYMTKEAYENFYTDRGAYIRNKNSSGYTGDIEDLEISDVKIDLMPNTNGTYHYYNVSLTLKNNDIKNEAEVSYQISLEKENNKWKIGMNNRLDTLLMWIQKMWPTV
ncbi:hypothetical protein [Clostridium sp.]|uniref:hypothetical protein n=1 Tax=Clostridium sp. TaxID=1506 RepID=UPI003216EECB